MKKFLMSIVMGVLLFSCGKKDSLVIYTNSGNNGRAEFLTKYAKENGFNVTVVDAGGSDISNRLVAEKNRPIADVVFGLNSIEYEKLKKEGVLEKFTPDWAKDVPDGLSDPEGYYNAVTVTPLLAVYNPEVIRDNVPTDWIEMATNPIFKGKYNIFGLSGGTGKVIFASIISRYQDPNGDLKISKEGWDMMKKFYENGHLQRGKEDWWGNMMNGKVPITMIWASGAIERGNKYHFNYGIMTPEIGVPFVVEQLAVVKGTKEEKLAEKFINWLGSADVQATWAQKFGTIPALPAALAKAPKQNKELFDKVKIQKLDWKFISENIDAWVEKAQLQFIK